MAVKREEIRLMIERDGSAKGIVFSQFTSFLDLIKYSLQKVKELLNLTLPYSTEKKERKKERTMNINKVLDICAVWFAMCSVSGKHEHCSSG